MTQWNRVLLWVETGAIVPLRLRTRPRICGKYPARVESPSAGSSPKFCPTTGASPLSHSLALRVNVTSQPPTVHGADECVSCLSLWRRRTTTHASAPPFKCRHVAVGAWFSRRTARSVITTGRVGTVLGHRESVPDCPSVCSERLQIFFSILSSLILGGPKGQKFV